MARKTWTTLQDFESRLEGPTAFSEQESSVVDAFCQRALERFDSIPAFADGIGLSAMRVASIAETTSAQDFELAARGRVVRLWHHVTGKGRSMEIALASNRAALSRAGLHLLANLSSREALTARIAAEVAVGLRRLSTTQVGLAAVVGQMAERLTDIELRVDKIELSNRFHTWRELIKYRKSHRSLAGWAGVVLTAYDAAEFESIPRFYDCLEITLDSRFGVGLGSDASQTRRKILHAVIEALGPDDHAWAAIALDPDHGLVQPGARVPFLGALADVLLLSSIRPDAGAAGRDAVIDLWTTKGLDADEALTGREALESFVCEWRTAQREVLTQVQEPPAVAVAVEAPPRPRPAPGGIVEWCTRAYLDSATSDEPRWPWLMPRGGSVGAAFWFTKRRLGVSKWWLKRAGLSDVSQAQKTEGGSGRPTMKSDSLRKTVRVLLRLGPVDAAEPDLRGEALECAHFADAFHEAAEWSIGPFVFSHVVIDFESVLVIQHVGIDP